MADQQQRDDQKPHNGKPISLYPLSVEEALRRAMQAKPEHLHHAKPDTSNQAGLNKNKKSVKPE